MFALRVKKEFTEEVRKNLFKMGLVDKKRVFLKNGGYVEVPLIRKLEKDEMELFKRQDARLINKKLPLKIFSKTPFETILEKTDIENKSLLPKKWEIIGDVLILKIPKGLEKHEKKIAKIYADVLNAKTAVKDMGITGRYRKPRIKILYGSSTETMHKENRIKFRLDASKLMFSSGNIDERIRMAYVSNNNEIVVDMFAGIGYFSIPIAVYSKPKKIFAYEINPDAYRYLCENIKLNNVQNVVIPVFEDNRNANENIADRVIMGYLKNTKDFLPKAFKILKKSGGIIHYHENYPNELLPEEPFKNIKKAAEKQGKTVKLLGFRNIKSYSPGVSHVVLDVKVRS